MIGRAFSIIALSVILVVLSGSNSSGLGVDESCKSVEVLFARGSGQDAEDNEVKRFRLQISDRVGLERIHFYELGTETYGGHKYPAVDIHNPLNGNPIGAWVSAGYANDYGKSVDAGVGELYNYVVQRHAKCPDARIILGGYSQGAQVIGQTLPKFSAVVQSKIDFVALFGDPKLYLPEGEGLLPPACRGKDFSLWRRDIGTCGTDNGSLGARKNPYLPASMTSKTGLWCNAADFICGTSKIIFDQAGHGKYKDAGGAIDRAAKEIAVKLRSTLPGSTQDNPDSGAGIDTESIVKTDKSKPDIVLAISSFQSGAMSMQHVISYIESNADRIRAQNGRVALISSRDAYNYRDNQAIVLSDFTDEPRDLIQYLRNFEYSGGGIMQWSGAHVVRTALSDLTWREESSKSILYLTDDVNMTFDTSPDLALQSLLSRALDLGGVGYYVLGGQQFASSHNAFSNVLAGKVIATDRSRYATDLEDIFAFILGRPQIQAKNSEYSAKSGQEVTFDLTDSFVANATISEYLWDFDGDGTVDRTTSVPIAHHIYDTQLDGYVIVKAKGTNGSEANTGIPIKIDITPVDNRPKTPTGFDIEVLSTRDNISTLKASWSAVDPSTKSLAISVNGVYVGLLDANRQSVEIRDIDRTKINDISIAGVSDSAIIGPDAIQTIQAISNESVNNNTNVITTLVTALLNAVRFILRSWGFVVAW